MTNHAGNSNTYLGSGTDCSGNFNNSTAIGSGSLITKSDQIVLGKNESPPEVYIPGNVGIGTNNPLFKLHVDGSIKLTGSLYTGTTEITPENLLTLVGVIIPLQEQLSGLQDAINTKQPTIENGHLQISYIDGLQTAIDAKQSVIGIDGLNIENILDLQTTITGIQADINSKLEEVGIDDIDDLREILTAKLEEVGIDDIDDLREILDSKQAVIGIDGLNIENIYGLQVAIEAKQDSIQDGDLPITVIDGLPTAIQSIQDAIATKQNEITGAASTIHDQQLDHQRVLVSNDLGKVIVSDITSSELEQLDGVSSNIQTQIDLKAPLASPTFTGNTVVSGTLDVVGNVGIGTNNPTNRFQIQDDDFRAIKFGQDSGNGIHHMDYYNAGNHNEHSPEATKEAVETSAKGFYINYYSKENIILNGNGGNGGNVGIGTNNPSEKLEVNGNVKATSYTATSDVRHKENICDLDRALEKICSIRGVNFNLKNNDDNDDGVSKKYAGILAQEVHEIIPEAICKKDDDKWTANYNTFIGYLIESVKTLKSENDEYKKGNEEQQTRIETLESKLETQGRLIQIDGSVRK